MKYEITERFSWNIEEKKVHCENFNVLPNILVQAIREDEERKGSHVQQGDEKRVSQ